MCLGEILFVQILPLRQFLCSLLIIDAEGGTKHPSQHIDACLRQSIALDVEQFQPSQVRTISQDARAGIRDLAMPQVKYFETFKDSGSNNFRASDIAEVGAVQLQMDQIAQVLRVDNSTDPRCIDARLLETAWM